MGYTKAGGKLDFAHRLQFIDLNLHCQIVGFLFFESFFGLFQALSPFDRDFGMFVVKMIQINISEMF